MIKIYYFSTEFCGPCKMFRPIMEQFAKENPHIEMSYKDANEYVKEFSITSVPTVVFLKGDKEEARLIGVKSKKMLEQALEDITF